MASYLSQDLRIRVIRAVEGGMSRTAATKRFGISPSRACDGCRPSSTPDVAHPSRAVATGVQNASKHRPTS